jgi:hypothetical protein
MMSFELAQQPGRLGEIDHAADRDTVPAKYEGRKHGA